MPIDWRTNNSKNRGLVVGGRPGPQSVIRSLETDPGRNLHTSSPGTRNLTMGNSEGGTIGLLKNGGGGKRKRAGRALGLRGGRV